MSVHKGVRVRLLSPAGPLLDVGSYYLYLSAQLRQSSCFATGDEWVTLFPINLADGTAIQLQVMPVEEAEAPEEGEPCDAGAGGPFQCELIMDHDGSHTSTFKWDSD